MQYDIFISYKRRGTSSATAAYIYDLLTKKGFSVFFDRKEIRQGRFDTQLLTHIENAKDIFVLLEDTSLDACFNGVNSEAYKTDWFCMEIMHALKKNKRIIPVLLDGYKMPEMKDLPDELKRLSLENAFQLDISEIDDFYKKILVDKGILISKPRILTEQSDNCVSNFLFYCDEDCDIYEFGNLKGHIDQNIDEEHPFIYPVKFAGEHRFKFINNDTCEEQKLSISIEKDKQLYVPIAWKSSQNLWELTDEIIAKQEDSQALYLWGKGLYEGSSKHEPDYELSFKCLERSAQMWCLDAKRFIINKCDDIFNNPKTKDVELQWFKKAAEYDCGPALFLLGKKYHYGIGVEKNIEEAIKYYEKAITQDEPRACNNLGAIYVEGMCGVKQDVPKGLELYHKAAEMGRPIAMYNLGNIYFYGQKGVKKDVSKGLGYFEKSAATGSCDSLCSLGLIYIEGANNVSVNSKKGLDYLEKAADEGCSDALVYLGVIYINGANDIKVDIKKGMCFLEKAAKLGNIDAINELGNIYFYGKKGIKTDITKGVTFYEEAAKAGNTDAIGNLGIAYYNGKQIPQNIDKSIGYFKQLQQEDSFGDANFALSIIYKKGNGIPKNIVLSKKYAQKATDIIENKHDKDMSYNRIAWVLCLMHEYKEALVWVQKLIKEKKDNAEYLDTIATAYRGLGRYDEALKYYQKALDLGRTEAAQDIEEVKKLIAKSKKKITRKKKS